MLGIDSWHVSVGEMGMDLLLRRITHDFLATLFMPWSLKYNPQALQIFLPFSSLLHNGVSVVSQFAQTLAPTEVCKFGLAKTDIVLELFGRIYKPHALQTCWPRAFLRHNGVVVVWQVTHSRTGWAPISFDFRPVNDTARLLCSIYRVDKTKRGHSGFILLGSGSVACVNRSRCIGFRLISMRK